VRVLDLQWIAVKAVQGRVVTVEDGVCADKPEVVALITVAVLDPVGAQAVGIVAMVLIDPELVAVVAVQTVLGAEPHKAPAVLDDAVDRALGKTVLDGELPELDTPRWRDGTGPPFGRGADIGPGGRGSGRRGRRGGRDWGSGHGRGAAAGRKKQRNHQPQGRTLRDTIPSSRPAPRHWLASSSDGGTGPRLSPPDYLTTTRPF
jgi:hypothetical protein